MDASGTLCQYSPHRNFAEPEEGAMTPTATDTVTPDVEDVAAESDRDDAVLSELLVEEISIDGMCGVY
jgi:mycofactocin precursor